MYYNNLDLEKWLRFLFMSVNVNWIDQNTQEVELIQ